MLRQPTISCKGVWGTLTLDAFVIVKSAKYLVEIRGPRIGGAEDSSLQSCYGLLTGRYCSLLVPKNACIRLIYMSPYLAATCFGWWPFLGSSQLSSSKLTVTSP
jgi:hypothetical protein